MSNGNSMSGIFSFHIKQEVELDLEFKVNEKIQPFELTKTIKREAAAKTLELKEKRDQVAWRRQRRIEKMDPDDLILKRKDMAERARIRRLHETAEEAEERRRKMREAAAFKRAAEAT